MQDLLLDQNWQSRYERVEPPANAKHGLPTYRSLTGVESLLESFWDSLCHFANTGTNPEYCDMLMLTGLAKHNTKMRHRAAVRHMPPSERPTHDEPRHWNHLLLQAIHDLAVKVGIDPPKFCRDARPLPEDNGERFFYEYFKQLEQRNSLAKPVDPVDPVDCCRCDSCLSPPGEALQVAGQVSESLTAPQQDYAETRPDRNLPAVVPPHNAAIGAATARTTTATRTRSRREARTPHPTSRPQVSMTFCAYGAIAY